MELNWYCVECPFCLLFKSDSMSPDWDVTSAAKFQWSKIGPKSVQINSSKRARDFTCTADFFHRFSIVPDLLVLLVVLPVPVLLSLLVVVPIPLLNFLNFTFVTRLRFTCWLDVIKLHFFVTRTLAWARIGGWSKSLQEFAIILTEADARVGTDEDITHCQIAHTFLVHAIVNVAVLFKDTADKIFLFREQLFPVRGQLGGASLEGRDKVLRPTRSRYPLSSHHFFFRSFLNTYFAQLRNIGQLFDFPDKFVKSLPAVIQTFVTKATSFRELVSLCSPITN